ncbi:MAG TPA: hypothetical protein VE462_00275 [Propionibacteriaceae bacterium]|nr:hypothetical protein [Propionibacteriaceae bacterium]
MPSGDAVIRRTTSLVALIALLAAVSWFAAAQSASAGGPTSVLLASPQTGRVAALYHTDSAYDRLADAVGAFESGTGSTDKPAAVPDDPSGEIRLTWLIHDMRIWRIDRVHVTTEDGIWMQTVVRTDGSGEVLDLPGTWHRPVDPEALAAAVRDAGLEKTSAADDNRSSSASSATSSPAAVTNAAMPGAASPSVGLVAAVGIGGVLVGAAGSTLLLRSRAGRQDRSVLTG